MGKLAKIYQSACLLTLVGLLACGNNEGQKPAKPTEPSAPSQPAQPSSPSQPVVGLAVGNLAPDFTLKDRDGKDVKLSDFRGKMVLMDFWATWCGPCMRAVPKLEALANEMGDKLVFLCVSLDESWGKKKKAAWLEMLADPEFATFGKLQHVLANDEVVNKYAAEGIPQQCLVDQDGKVLAYPEAGDVKAAEKKIRELIK